MYEKDLLVKILYWWIWIWGKKEKLRFKNFILSFFIMIFFLDFFLFFFAAFFFLFDGGGAITDVTSKQLININKGDNTQQFQIYYDTINKKICWLCSWKLNPSGGKITVDSNEKLTFSATDHQFDNITMEV